MGGRLVARDNGVAVRGAVAVDRGNRGLKRVDDADGDDEVEELGSKIGWRSGDDPS